MQSSKLSFIFFALLFVLAASSCRPLEEETKVDDQKLAQVGGKILYLSDLDGMISGSDKPEDSLMIVNAFVEEWVRDNLLMQEAERNIPNDLNIDQLVRDYRASLIRHSYEKRMVESQLDSTITQQELLAYYEENKEQYRLKDKILRCRLIKIPRPFDDLSIVKDLWKKNNEESYKALLEYCSQYAEVYMLEDSTWYRLNDIASQLPKGTLTKSSDKKSQIIKDDNYHYFIKVLETVSRKKIAPLTYIEDQASKVILHKRKIKLLEEKREEIYERAIHKNNVKVFVE